MKLTKLQRHTAYIILLVEFEETKTSNGACYLLFPFFETEMQKKLKKMLPEYHDHRTIPGLWYYRARYERINALKQCIEETY